MLQSHQAKTAPNEQSGNANTTRQLLKQADTLDAVIQVVCEGMAQRLSSMLMISVDEIDAKKPVVAYGLDSLAAAKFRNWIASGLESAVPLIELMNSPSIEHLAGWIVKKSRLVDKGLFSAEDGEAVAEKED